MLEWSSKLISSKRWHEIIPTIKIFVKNDIKERLWGDERSSYN